jgi:drug/metabolite transporter (DMT)-like permease
MSEFKTQSTAVQPPATLSYGALLIGVLAVSSAAIFIKHAQAAGADSLAIAAGRLGLASLVLFPIAAYFSWAVWRTLSRADWLKIIACGFLLAAHFALWISSLKLTSVAISTVFASTTPIWVALGAWFIYRERLGHLGYLGLALALGGSMVLGLNGGQAQTGGFFWGAFLSVSSAWMVAAYFLISQGLRQRLNTLAFIGLTFSIAALFLILTCLFTQTPLLGLPQPAYQSMLLLALIPQLIGHSVLNWAIPKLGATVVTVSVLGEPVGAALLAVWLLSEPVSGTMVLLFGVILTGILLVALKK